MSKKIVVVGMGYVGIPAAVLLADVDCYNVVKGCGVAFLENSDDIRTTPTKPKSLTSSQFCPFFEAFLRPQFHPLFEAFLFPKCTTIGSFPRNNPPT